MNDSREPKNLNLSVGLSKWCHQAQIDASALASHTGFSYMHAWRLLSGKSPVTVETLGRFLLAYGHEAAGELISMSNTLSDDPMSSCITLDDKIMDQGKELHSKI